MKDNNLRPKRIAFMSSLPPPSTGEANVTQTYFESLPDQGYEVFLIDTGVREKKKMPGVFSVYNVLRFFEHFISLAKCCIQHKPDMINLMFASRAILKFALFTIFAKMFGVKVIGQMHDPSMDKMYSVSSRGRKKYLRFVFSLPSGWIVLGEKWYEFMLQVGVSPDKLWVIPNAVKGVFSQVVLEGRKPEETSPPCILFVGRVGVRKGVDLLLDALVDLQDEGVDFQAKIVGETYLPGDMEKYKVDFGDRLEPDRFEFIPHQENEKLIELFLQASVFVLPSRAENLPVVMLEAMACGNAVVATDVGAVSDVIKNYVNGIIIPPNDSQMISGAIVELLKDAQLRKTMGENAQKTILANHLSRVAGEKMNAFICHLDEQL